MTTPRVLLGLGRLVLQATLVLLAVSTILFFLIRLSGDPAALLAGQDAGQEVIARTRDQLGLNDPLILQYGRFLWGLVRFDFGVSIRTRASALAMIVEPFPNTLLLSGLALLMALVISVPAGIAAASARGVARTLVSLVVVLGQSVPNFALGILLIFLFAVTLHVLPSFGAGGPAHLVLPVFTLGAYLIAKYARLVRSGMLEVLGEDYVRTARAKGLSQRGVLWRHAFPNTLLPLVAVLGVDASYLLGGSVIVETVFAWPGAGRQMVQAVIARDYPVVEAGTFLLTILVVAINVLVDALYRVVDPRLRGT